MVNGMRKENDMTGGYQCFHCGAYAVYWSGDFDFSDYCLEGEGIIHECRCSNCGAEITYKISIGGDEDASEES